jgi:hypothetical protein
MFTAREHELQSIEKMASGHDKSGAVLQDGAPSHIHHSVTALFYTLAWPMDW